MLLKKKINKYHDVIPLHHHETINVSITCENIVYK